MSTMVVDAFTISSNNYLGMARVFADSYREWHPGASVYVCLVDRPDARIAYDELPFEVVPADELHIPDFDHLAFRYNILELNTAVKPFMFRYLRDNFGIDRALYFDPDILVQDRLVGVEESLAAHEAVLTPHLTEPLDNRYRPPERMIGVCGVYNLGFLGLRLNDSTSRFLDWWCDRLHRFCVVDLANGMFVDQSWMDFAPSYLDSVAILRDPIFNIAYWNLPHRMLSLVGDHWEVGGRRVGFVHFSGVDLANLDLISRHQDRVDLWRRPELRPLFEHYRDLVDRSGQRDFRRCAYSFGSFAGVEIAVPQSVRTTLQEVDPAAKRWSNPFQVGGNDSFLNWLTEPVQFAGEIVNRAALGLWRDRADIRHEFPKLEDGDLGRFIDWYLDGGAKAAALDGVFSEPLRSAVAVTRRLSHVVHDVELERAAAIDLCNPGEDAGWLNQPMADGQGPVVTRLAMLIHQTRLDLQEKFPDPIGQDRLDFAYWMASDGLLEYGLHDSLVRLTRWSLPVRSRTSVRLRVFAARIRNGRRSADPGRLPTPDTPFPVPDAVAAEGFSTIERQRAPHGVNLVGFFEGGAGARCFAPWIENALMDAGVPHVNVPLDHWLVDDLSCDRFRHDSGFPFEVTVLAVEPRLWDTVVRQVPCSARAGGCLIGYCQDPSELRAVRALAAFHEIWVPTATLERGAAEITSLRIRRVVPQVPAYRKPGPPWTSSLDPGCRWFLAVDHDREEESARATSATIECVRQLAREQVSGWRFCLMVGKDRFELAGQLAHLPIRVEVIPDADEDIDGLLSMCSGFVDLRPGPHVCPMIARAAVHGVPIISASDELERPFDGFAVDRKAARGAAGSASRGIDAVVEALRAVLSGDTAPLGVAFRRGEAIARDFAEPAPECGVRSAIERAVGGSEEFSKVTEYSESTLQAPVPELAWEPVPSGPGERR